MESYDEKIKAAESSRAASQQGNTYTPNKSGTSSTSSTYTGSTCTPRSTHKYRSYRSKENLDWVVLSLGYVQIYLGVFGGAGFDCIAKGVIKIADVRYGDADALESSIQKRFNASWEVGATFCYRNFQLGYTYSRGILNHADDDSCDVKQNKPMRLDMTIFF